MSGFALSNAEYDWIYWHIPEKNSAEYDIIILSVSDAVYSIRSLNSLSSYQDRHIHCQTFKIMHFAKRIMPECRCTTRTFSGQEEGFVERGHFDKHFIKNKIRAFLSKIRKLLSPKFCTCECGWNASIFLNMPKYPWKWLNKPLCLNCLSSEYVWLWLHTPQYCLIMPQYALMVLNMSECGSIFLNVSECMNIPKYAWIICSD